MSTVAGRYPKEFKEDVIRVARLDPDLKGAMTAAPASSTPGQEVTRASTEPGTRHPMDRPWSTGWRKAARNRGTAG